MLKDEVDYNIDLNEDGYIGDVIAAKYSSHDTTLELYKTTSGSYVCNK